MTAVDVPPPDSKLDIQIKGLPIRLWWSLVEAAQKQKVPLNYFIFRTLAEAVNFGADGDSYDLLVLEIKRSLEGDGQ